MTKHTLPQDPAEAVQRMLEIVRNLRDLTLEEASALDLRDAARLKVAQAQKADATATFEKAAREFHKRVDEFKTVNQSLRDELETEQTALREAAVQVKRQYDVARSA